MLCLLEIKNVCLVSIEKILMNSIRKIIHIKFQSYGRVFISFVTWYYPQWVTCLHTEVLFAQWGRLEYLDENVNPRLTCDAKKGRRGKIVKMLNLAEIS